jgi:hypothetical protein
MQQRWRRLARVRGKVTAFGAMFDGGSVWVLGMTSLSVSAQNCRSALGHGSHARDVSIHGPGWHCVGRPDMGCRRFAKQHFDDAEYRSPIHGVQPGCGDALSTPESERFALERAKLMPTPIIGDINSDVGSRDGLHRVRNQPRASRAIPASNEGAADNPVSRRRSILGCFRHTEKPARYIEYFMLESWFEHLRQHGRATGEDSPAFERARQFHLGPTPRLPSDRGRRIVTVRRPKDLNFILIIGRIFTRLVASGDYAGRTNSGLLTDRI